MVFRQPALVRVGRRAVAFGRKLCRVCRVGHIHDGHRVFVARKRDFLARVLSVRADVVHHLRVVGVAVFREEPEQCGVERVGDVHDVQSARCGVGAHTVCPAAFFVDYEVVRVAKPAVPRIAEQRHRGVRDVAKTGQIEHLHAVSSSFRHDERVVVVDLDVAPQGRRGFGADVGQIDRVQRVGDVDEGGAVGSAQNHVLLSVKRVGPTPNVIHVAAAHFVHTEGGEQVHVLTWVAGAVVVGSAIDAWGLRNA